MDIILQMFEKISRYFFTVLFDVVVAAIAITILFFSGGLMYNAYKSTVTLTEDEISEFTNGDECRTQEIKALLDDGVIIKGATAKEVKDDCEEKATIEKQYQGLSAETN